jgi:hypothetical protein
MARLTAEGMERVRAAGAMALLRGHLHRQNRGLEVAKLIDGYPCDVVDCMELAQGAVFIQLNPDEDPDAIHFFCRAHLKAVCQ